MEYNIDEDEVILYKGLAQYDVDSKKINISFILTSKKMVFIKEKGVFKKEKEIIDIIELKDIKIFNDNVQCKQKMSEIEIQTKKKELLIIFGSFFEAKKVYNLIINTITGKTTAKRQSEKIKAGFEIVDDTLGIDTRGTVRGIIENGITGVVFKGVKNVKGIKGKKK